MTDDTISARIARYVDAWGHSDVASVIIIDCQKRITELEREVKSACQALQDEQSENERLEKRIEELERELREDHKAEAQTQAEVLKIDQENERLKAQLQSAEAKHLADNQKADEYYDRTQVQLESAEALLRSKTYDGSKAYHERINREIADYFAKKEAKDDTSRR